MSTIIQMDLQAILENPIAIYLSFALLVAALSTVLYVQSRRRSRESYRLAAHLEAILAELRSIKDSTANLRKLSSFAESLEIRYEEVEGGIAGLHSVCASTSEAIQTVSSATVEKLSDFLNEKDKAKRDAEEQRAAELKARQEGEILLSKQTRIEEARKRYEAMSESEMCRISNLVSEISEGLASQSALTNGCEKAIGPYLELASKLKDMAVTIGQLDPSIEDSCEAVESLLDSLQQEVRELQNRHRPAWCIGLLDLSRKFPSLEAQSKTLQNLLNLEDLQVQSGTALTDYKDLEPVVLDSDGDGFNSVITELVEVGYRNKETGAVLKQPRVRVRFEG